MNQTDVFYATPQQFVVSLSKYIRMVIYLWLNPQVSYNDPIGMHLKLPAYRRFYNVVGYCHETPVHQSWYWFFKRLISLGIRVEVMQNLLPLGK